MEMACQALGIRYNVAYALMVAKISCKPKYLAQLVHLYNEIKKAIAPSAGSMPSFGTSMAPLCADVASALEKALETATPLANHKSKRQLVEHQSPRLYVEVKWRHLDLLARLQENKPIGRYS